LLFFPFSWSGEKVSTSFPKCGGDDIGDGIGDGIGDDMKILPLLEKEPDITAKKLSEKAGFSTRKISRIIKSLWESGRIIRIGSDRKGYWESFRSLSHLRWRLLMLV
jgi:hypothetical protein